MRRFDWISLGVALVVLSAPRAEAQGWARTIGGEWLETASDIRPTIDGGFIVAGTTASFGHPKEHLWVLKLDAAGGVTWQVSYPTGAIDVACCLEPTPDGGHLVAGNGNAAAGDDAWIIKLDSSGAIAWQRSYAGIDDGAQLRQVLVLRDGSLVAVGQGHSSGSDTAWILHLDAAGQLLRMDTYLSAQGVAAWTARQAPDGGLVVAGLSGWADAWLLRLDAAGAIVSQQALKLGSKVYALARLEPTADGGWILGGWMDDYGSMGQAAVASFAIKLDASLAITWASRLSTGTLAGARLSTVRQAPDGGYFLAGHEGDGSEFEGAAEIRGAFVVKLDPAGAIDWQRAYGPAGNAVASLVPMADGGAVAAGHAARPAARTGGDLLLLRVDADGQVATECTDVIDGPFAALPLNVTTASTSVTVGIGSVSVQPRFATGVDSTAVLVDLGDRYEDDDSCASRGRLHDGETTRHDFCDDPEDWFTLDACEGATYTITTSNLGPLANTVVDVLGPDCTATLVSDDDGGGGRASLASWVATSDGAHHVLVRQLDGVAGPGRRYDVTLTRTGPGCATWARTFGDAWGEGATVRARVDGTLVVAATTASVPITWPGNRSWNQPFESAGPAVAALDASGDVVWHERLFSLGPQHVIDLALTPDGGSAMAAVVRGDRGFLVRLDALGGISWQRSYDDLYPSRVRALRDGSLAMAGFFPGVSGRWDYFVARFDALGNATWSVAAGGSSDDRATDLIETVDGDLFVVGSSHSFVGTWVMRLDPAGVVKWQRAYPTGGLPTGGFGWPVTAQAADGNLLVAVGDSVVKLDGNGDVTWRHVFTSASDLTLNAAAIEATVDGGCVVTGGTRDERVTWPIVLKLNVSGNVEWQRVAADWETRPGYGFTGLAVTPDLGVVVAGWRTRSGEAIVARLDRDGGFRGSCLFSDADLVMSCRAVTSTAVDLAPVPVALNVSDASFVAGDLGRDYEQACAGSAARPPWEVSPPGSPQPLLFASHATLTWEDAAASGSTTFNVYRGDVASLHAGSYGACFRSFVPVSTVSDPAVPPAGVAWTYLVTGRNAIGEGPMGRTSFGTARPNAAPCP